jgi:hypothetical protein
MKPPLLLASVDMLDLRDGGAADRLDPKRRLLPVDEETIRRTYAHYWGRIYLAGREWRDLGAGDGASFEIIVPGEYTLLSQAPVVVDARPIPSGGVLTLEAGNHQLRTTGLEPHLRILWGEDVRIPNLEAAPEFR